MYIIAVMIGGASGALLRYLTSGWMHALLGDNFPWGTLAVNLAGSFLIGFFWHLFESYPISAEKRALLFTGGLGAFTTFSTYNLENVNLMQNGRFNIALINIAASAVIGVAMVFAGMATARLLTAD